MNQTPLRYGVIGTGMMGQEHIHNIVALDAAKVVALCDSNKKSLREAEEILSSAQENTTEVAGKPANEVVSFTNHQDLLAAGVCDALVVATPNMTHLGILLDVIAAGVPVLVEKPLCSTVADCQKIVAAASSARSGTDRSGTDQSGTDQSGTGSLVWVGLEYRFMPAIAQLLAQVATGMVGDVRMVSIREHRFPFLTKVDDWNRFNKNTGGTLVEKCCHFFDLMNIITNARPTRVMASGGQDVNHLHESYNGETPDILDNAYVVVDFDSGARAMLDLCMFAEATQNQEELSVVGNLGKVEALIPDSTVRTGIRGNHWIGNVDEQTATNPEIRYQGHHHGASYVEHLRFGAAVRSLLASSATGSATGSATSLTNSPRNSPTSAQGINESSPEAGLMSVAIGVAAQMSIDQGRFVDMDEVLEPTNP